MAKIGDTVRFLNSVGGGIISRINGNMAYVEDEDGFETPVLLRECVVVQPATQQARIENSLTANTGSKPTAPKPATAAPDVVSSSEVSAADMAETPGGERLNIVLGFEPENIKALSGGNFICSLVNDSNYWLMFTMLTCSNADITADNGGWQTVYSGVVEPNIQLDIDSFDSAKVASFDRIAIQYIAFKRNKPFCLKTPATVQLRVDTTKFYKLHCFRNNPYFDNPVLAFDIVTDDKPASLNTLKIDVENLSQMMRRKAVADQRPARRQVHKKPNDPGKPLVIDLHIHELVDNIRGLSNADMLNLQIDTFRRAMDENLRNHGRKLIFIHGKGDGILRNAILKELNHRYKGHDVQDASFAEYGYGATQIKIH